MNTRILGLLLSTTALAMSGCGGSGDSGGGTIDSMTLEQSVIAVGGATVIDVDFSYDAGNVFDNDARVILHVLLPAGVGFRSGSAEVDTVGGNDISASANVTNCASSGETLVTFDLDEDELLGALNPGGDADATLTFTVDGIAATQGVIQGRADDTADSTICGQPFTADATAFITVQ